MSTGAQYRRLKQHIALCLAFCFAAFGTSAGVMRASAPFTPRPGGRPLPGLEMSGDPESRHGVTWTFNASVDRVNYDLQGILLKPSGQGPFPAVIISHGMRGNAFGASHTDGILDRQVFARIRAWYTKYGMFGGLSEHTGP
jgi:hypothetical protein